MILATVSSRSCFCWLYRASPSLAAKNVINLISVLTIWWCLCVQSSLVLLEEGVCYDQCILLAKLYWSWPCFILYSKAKFACYSRCFLTSTFAFQSPVMKRTSLWGVSSRRTCKSFNFSFFNITGQGIDLDFCDIEWFALEMNRDHSVIFEISSKYYISDYEGYSIFSKGFLPTVVDIMVIWVKFAHSSPF